MRSVTGAPTRSWIAPHAPSEPLLYVSDYIGGYVNIYSQNGQNQAPIGQLTGFSTPAFLYVSKAGDLYVANDNAYNVLVFHRGATSPFETLNVPVIQVYQVTEDSSGTTYVSGSTGSAGGATIEVYAAGSLNPTSSLSDPNYAYFVGVTTDSKGNIYTCADQTGSYTKSGTVEEFLAGSTTPINLGLHTTGCYGLAIGPRDNLLVADFFAKAIEVFPPGSTMPATTIKTNGLPISLSLNANVSAFYVGTANHSVLEYTVGGKLIDTITNGITEPVDGVATDPGYYPY